MTAEAEKVSEKAAKLSTSEEVIHKCKEREAKRAAMAHMNALTKGVPIDNTISILLVSAPTAGDERSATLSKLMAQTFNLTTPTNSSQLGWYNPTTPMYSTLDAVHEVGVWTYPYEHTKHCVFQDLWGKCNFMGGGAKSRGDFLIYPSMFSISGSPNPTHRLFLGDPL